MAKQKPYAPGPNVNQKDMSEQDALSAFKQLTKSVKGYADNFEDLTARYGDNKRSRYFGKIIRFFSESELKTLQVNNHNLEKAMKTEVLIKKFEKSQGVQFFIRENGRHVTNLKNTLTNFKAANPRWVTNPYLKLKVEFITEAIALYVADQLCHKSDELFDKYEKAFAALVIPHRAK